MPRLVHVATIVAVTLTLLTPTAFAEPVGAQAACPIPPPGSYAPPVNGVVVDGFRPPQAFAGPGNRGWEYETAPGAVVHAAGPGVVVFAGSVAGHPVVSIDHRDGLRTTYSWLAAAEVSRGDAVGRGTPLGTSTGSFHFGVRCAGDYMDPALLFATSAPGRPHLVPLPPEVHRRVA